MTELRDFYKILGVRANATEEKIRERWIKLNRRLHPDREAKRGADDGRLREINEAYNILKHSSTRVQYDLKRAYDRKKRKASVRRRVMLPTILILLLISILIYFWMSQMGKGSGMEASRTASPPEIEDQRMGKEKYVPKVRPEVEISESKKHEKLEETVLQKEKGSEEKRPIFQKLLQPEIPGETIPVASPKPMTNTPLPMTSHSTPRPSSSMPHDPLPMTNSPDQRRDVSVTHDPLPMTSSSTQRPNDSMTSSPGDAAMERHNDAKTVLGPNDVLKAEVREFLSKYAERYVEKDIEGFLSLFSSRAALNQKGGLEEIRKIYAHFFNESQELRYRLKDPMVEVNRTGLEVKARFEVDQVLRKEGEKKIWRGQIRWLLSRENDALKIVMLDYQYQ